MPDAFLKRLAELQVDEEQALADALRAEGMTELSGSGTIWWIILCVIGLLVSAALLVLAGQKRRERRYAEDEPSFDGYAVGDEFASEEPDDFASVEIEERPAMPWHRVAAEQAEAPKNVVPIRQADDVPAMTAAEPEVDEMPARYAFAGGSGSGHAAAAGSASGLAQRSVYGDASDNKSQGGPVPEQPRFMDRASSETRHRDPAPTSRSYDDRPRASGDDQPFVAPFIREDIERAERRQADRIETLRDEVSRQFQAMKSENASRLDLFVAAVDRKLETVGARPSGVSETDMQRVTEGSVRPIFDRLERLAGQVSTQEQRLSDLAQLIELRLSDLSTVRADLHDSSAMVSSLRDRTEDAQARMDALTDLVREQSGSVLAEMDSLQEGMARLERAILDRASEDGSVSIALSEVVRGTLAEGSYEFSKRLSNNETVDCVIAFGGLGEKIAIDASFPMQAFDQLPSRDSVRKNMPQAKAAEDTFRRAILRAILQAADRCIVPGETADSCLLFLPSEAAYTILHDRFGDLVRDAQRARVWLTSPSTLMGTLNLLSNLLPATAPTLREPERDERAEAAARAEAEKRDRAKVEADRREAERRAMRDEIKALRERAAGLAGELDRTRGTLSELIDTTERLSGVEDEDVADDDYTAPDWAEDDREDRYDD